MLKNLKSNWRELVALIVVNLILFALLMALGTVKVSESGPLSTFVSQSTRLAGIASVFAFVLSLAWFGLAVTYPEAARFLLSERFDNAWKHCTDHQKLNTTLISAAVLAIVAAIVSTAA